MTTDPPEPKARRKWHFYKWLVLLIVATSAYAAWNAYLFRSALKEAKALGWDVTYTDPYAQIRADWKAAFKKQTWLEGVSVVIITTGEELEKHPAIVRRLNPKALSVFNSDALHDFSAIKSLNRLEILSIMRGSSLANIDELKNLTALEKIYLPDCTKITNVDALQKLSALKRVLLPGCTALTNVDAFKNLLTLKEIVLDDCKGLTNMDALKHLSKLEVLSLADCTGLTNVNALKGLTALQEIDLRNCTGLTKESIAALKAALPKTKIYAN